jgi:DNA helicase II / ATP-dependent DNA helicase PcrA
LLATDQEPITPPSFLVMTMVGAGADARAQVSFSRHGVKWLALSVAKLTPVED